MTCAKKMMSVIVQKLRPRRCATSTARLTPTITPRIRSILLRTVCQLVTWTTMTADTTARAAASTPNREETISQDNPAASALLIANRSNGDLDDQTSRNLSRGGCGRGIRVSSLCIAEASGNLAQDHRSCSQRQVYQ